MQLTIDTKLKLLAGLPINVENFGEIKPLKLKQIIEFGYEKYLKVLNVFSINKDQLIDNPPEEITEFDLLYIVGEKEILDVLHEGLELFMQDKVHFLRENQIIAIGTNDENIRLITRKNFNDIRYVLQLQNYVISVDEISNVKIKNNKAKEVAEKLKKAQAEVKRIKAKESQEESESDFFDILSAISSKSNSINKIDLLDLTIFQIYEEFRRLTFIDNYNTNVLAMLQGAKNIKLQHWSSKIKS